MTKTIRISARAAAAAKALAIRYDAFQEACRENRHSGIISWGFMLQSVQKELGIEVVEDAHIERMMDMSIRATAKPASEHLRTVLA